MLFLDQDDPTKVAIKSGTLSNYTADARGGHPLLMRSAHSEVKSCETAGSIQHGSEIVLFVHE